MVIRFDRPNVQYEQALYDALEKLEKEDEPAASVARLRFHGYEFNHRQLLLLAASRPSTCPLLGECPRRGATGKQPTSRGAGLVLDKSRRRPGPSPREARAAGPPRSTSNGSTRPSSG